MRIAVVGGNGFLGSHLVDRLRRIEPDKLELVQVISRRGSLPESARHDPRFVALPWNARSDRDCAWMAQIDVLINLVGIKQPTRDNSFEFAHVEIPRLLSIAAQRCQVKRLIHISVAGCRPQEHRPYLLSKWRGENIVRDAKIPHVILRPGIMYGPGDDLLLNLVRLIRHSPWIVAPNPTAHHLQLVKGTDVANAIIQCCSSESATEFPFIDLVNSEKLAFADLVDRISLALRLRSTVLSCPRKLIMPAAALFEAIQRDPILSRAQLCLLSEGVEGDEKLARKVLKWKAEPFCSELIKDTIIGDSRLARPLFGFSLRRRSIDSPASPTPKPASRPTSRPTSRPGSIRFQSTKNLIFVVGLVMALMWILPLFLNNIWQRVFAINILQMFILLRTCDKSHLQLFRPSFVGFGWGTLSAVVLWSAGYGVLSIADHYFLEISSQLAEIQAWTTVYPAWITLSMVIWTLSLEEAFWRGLVNFHLFDRFGGSAIFLSAGLFALAHLNSGPPILLAAAFFLGLVWSSMAIRTRCLFVPWLCHLIWDLLVLYLVPYSNLLN